jgi:hypothetical protein
MAKLRLIGDIAQVELTRDDEDGQVIATCILHPSIRACAWTERYDTMDDAVEYAADHVDGR